MDEYVDILLENGYAISNYLLFVFCEFYIFCRYQTEHGIETGVVQGHDRSIKS